MKKNTQKILRTSFSLALAAAVAIASTGCKSTAHSSGAPSDAVQTTDASPAGPAENTDQGSPEVVSNAGDTNSVETAATDSAAAAATAAAIADPADESATAATAAAETAAEESTSAAADETAAAAEEDSDVSSTEAAEAATEEDAAPEGELEADEEGDTAPEADSEDAEAAPEADDDVDAEEDIPARDASDTALMESVLAEALVQCTGWGQSAGSSLRAAAAATQLLTWANEAQAGQADPSALKDAVKAEIGRLSTDQLSNLKSNWSFISYDADMILDDFSAVEGVLSDAGYVEEARTAAADENAMQNWKSLSEVMEDALKK